MRMCLKHAVLLVALLKVTECPTQLPRRQGVFGLRFRTLQFIVARDMLDSSAGQSTEKDACGFFHIYPI